jgi:hypothetical protein
MYSIICTFDSFSQSRISEIRDSISLSCPGGAVKVGLEPHVSLQGADDYPIERVEGQIQKLTLASPAFKVYVGGLGIFTGETPVVYLVISKTPQLYKLHLALWEAVAPSGENVNQLFAPPTWIPHISLFYGDKGDPEQVSCVVNELMRHDLMFEVTIKQLSIVYKKGEQYGIRAVFPLVSE